MRRVVPGINPLKWYFVTLGDAIVLPGQHQAVRLTAEPWDVMLTKSACSCESGLDGHLLCGESHQLAKPHRDAIYAPAGRLAARRRSGDIAARWTRVGCCALTRIETDLSC